jgi:hypothetical protein
MELVAGSKGINIYMRDRAVLGVKKVIEVSIRNPAQWYEYVPLFKDAIEKRRCWVDIEVNPIRSVARCRAVEVSKKFVLRPVFIIKPGNGVITVIVGGYNG